MRCTFTRWRGDAREPAEESAETGTKFIVHPAVDERIVAAVAHGQPVTQNPHCLNMPITHTQRQIEWYKSSALEVILGYNQMR